MSQRRAYFPLGKLYWDPVVPDHHKVRIFKLTCAPSYERKQDKRFGLLWAVKTGQLEVVGQAVAHDRSLVARKQCLEGDLLVTPRVADLALVVGNTSMGYELHAVLKTLGTCNAALPVGLV